MVNPPECELTTVIPKQSELPCQGTSEAVGSAQVTLCTSVKKVATTHLQQKDKQRSIGTTWPKPHTNVISKKQHHPTARSSGQGFSLLTPV